MSTVAVMETGNIDSLIRVTITLPESLRLSLDALTQTVEKAKAESLERTILKQAISELFKHFYTELKATAVHVQALRIRTDKLSKNVDFSLENEVSLIDACESLQPIVKRIRRNIIEVQKLVTEWKALSLSVRFRLDRIKKQLDKIERESSTLYDNLRRHFRHDHLMHNAYRGSKELNMLGSFNEPSIILSQASMDLIQESTVREYSADDVPASFLKAIEKRKQLKKAS